MPTSIRCMSGGRLRGSTLETVAGRNQDRPRRRRPRLAGLLRASRHALRSSKAAGERPGSDAGTLGCSDGNFVTSWIGRFSCRARFFIRADGRVRYVKVSTRQQMAGSRHRQRLRRLDAGEHGRPGGSADLPQPSKYAAPEAESPTRELRAQVAASHDRFTEIATALTQPAAISAGSRERPVERHADAGAGAGSDGGGDRRRSRATGAGGDAANLATIASNNQTLGQQFATIESHVDALDEARRACRFGT